MFCNVFGIEIGVKMMAVKLEYKYWSIIKTFLVFLKYIEPTDLIGIEMDKKIITALRKI